MSTDFNPVEAGAEALVQHETSGMCLPGKKCQMCDCGVQDMGREGLAEDLRRNQDRARAVLAAALDRDELATVLYEAWRTRWVVPGHEFPAWDDLNQSPRGDWLADADAIRAWAGVTS